MSRINLRFIARHPVKWARVCWFHWTVALLLLLNAVLIVDELWAVTSLARYWPIPLTVAATMCVASSVALSHARLQTVTALTLFGVATWRASTYLLLWAADTSTSVDLLSQAFALHWLLLAAVATRWPIISTRAALDVSAQAGHDDQGPLRAAG